MAAESDTTHLLGSNEYAETQDDDVPNILSDGSTQAPLAETEDGDVTNILTVTQGENPAPDMDDDEVTNAMAAATSCTQTGTESRTEAAPTATSATTSGRTSTSSSSVSRRSRNRRHRHRRHHRRRPYFPGLKGKETNFLAAVCSMVVMVAVCTALVEPQWFTLYGGGCRDGKGDPIGSIGMTEFLRPGQFVEVTRHDKEVYSKTKYIYKYGHGDDQVMYDCVSPKMVQVLHCIAGLCFTTITLSLTAFLFDLAGPQNNALKEMRRHAVFNVVAVLLCVLVNGFCFWVTELLDALQDETKRHSSSRIEVQFSVSFYLMAAAGAMSVLAAACNLLRTNIQHHMEPRDAVVDERNELDLGYDHQGPPGLAGGAAAAFLPAPPPPPYVP